MITRLGLLGGGQLARMLLLSGAPLGIRVSVLTARADDPAAQVAGDVRLGAVTETRTLRKFLGAVDAVTFESEFVDIEAFRRVRAPGVYVFPSPKAIGLIQDRFRQKKLLDEFGLPTSPWMRVDDADDLGKARERFPRGFVLKQRRFGYDGYGTFFAEGGRGDPAWLLKSAHGFIAEEEIRFRRELAASFVRGRGGEFVRLPLVETVQVDGRCFSVRGPVDHPDFARLTARVKRLMTELGYVGILAVELFDLGEKLMVNELAPRVHNSAHYSQQALFCDQFEYHLRAGLGLSLPRPRLVAPAFAMVNLLGEGGRVRLDYAGPGKLHWYGKTENRPGRKLGHLNVLGSSPGVALKQALAWRKEIKL